MIRKIKIMMKNIKIQLGVIPGFIFYVSGDPENVAISNFSDKIPYSMQCVCVSVCAIRANSRVCLLFTVPPLAQAGATGVRTNKHKRDFMPLLS